MGIQGQDLVIGPDHLVWCLGTICGSKLPSIRQQAVYQFVAYGRFSYLENFGSFLPLDRLHKI